MTLGHNILRKNKNTKVQFSYYKYINDFGLNKYVYECALENVGGS